MLPNHSSAKEKLQPAKVLSDFFDDYLLSEVWDILWQLVQVAITTQNDEYSEPEARADLLHQYSRLGELIEAAYIINHSDQSAPQQP